jgi:hypothetical protein
MKSEEIIWLIGVSIIVIIGLLVKIYIDRFSKWILNVLWLLYIPAIIYSAYCFFTLDIHHFKVLWGAFTIIFIFKMYRNRYMIMKD